MTADFGIWNAHECNLCSGTGVIEAGDGPNVREVPCSRCTRPQFEAEADRRFVQQARAAKNARTAA